MTISKRLLISLLVLVSISPILIFSQNHELPQINKTDTIIKHTCYTLNYSEYHEQALWVAYTLTEKMIYGEVKRKNNFKSDKSIPTKSASLSDYSKSGYDRGHLAPAADMKLNEQIMSESFLMSNMSPQLPGFNRGIWKKLEAWVRNKIPREKTLFIVTGPIFTSKNPTTIGENRVVIPDYYYKAIIDLTGKQKAIAFILPHQKSTAPLSNFATTIDYLEEILGIDLFYSLPDHIETLLESQNNFSMWLQ